MLAWIQNFLTNRTAQVSIQGTTSPEEPMELGTPQGSILSPLLFNVVMDKIAQWPFPTGTQIIIYADDILLQCPSTFTLQSALNELQNLCVNLGLEINADKTKFQAKGNLNASLKLNNTEIERVSTCKYLGVNIGFRKKGTTIKHIREKCLAYLSPLRMLANKTYGVGVSNLLMFYKSVIRSIIDYAAPALFAFSDSQLRPLETVQNEAMRIILGCPKTAKIEIMRKELNLPGIAVRIREITCRTIARMITTSTLPLSQMPLSTDVQGIDTNSLYLKKIAIFLQRNNWLDILSHLIPSPSMYTSPLQLTNVPVSIYKLPYPKNMWIPHELASLFLETISRYPKDHSIHIYCDGSVNGKKSGSGIFVREYNTATNYRDTTYQHRLPDNISSTRAELYTILHALNLPHLSNKSIYLFIDSQSALRALNARQPADSDLIIQ